ncbi:MAG: DUF262 domain-containing protein [Patescibacteria group bacterium]
MKIQDFINNRHKYIVDQTYQRPEGAWSKEDNQCLIDTILKGEPIPLFFFNLKSNEDKYYIVDGQQRLHAIKLFYDNKLKLNGKFSGDENHGKTFNGENPIYDDLREKFLNYSLSIHIIEDYDDEKIRVIFSRLQRGKPLTLGERLNAMPGEIVNVLRDISKHPFMARSIAVTQGRYGNYADAARILFYEIYGAKDAGTPYLLEFFEEKKDLNKESTAYKNLIKTLNFLDKCFPSEKGSYRYLSKHVWVLTVYTMIRELMKGYVLTGHEEEIREFVVKFHSKIYSEDHRSSNASYQKFYDNARGGWAERLTELRRSIILKEFLNKHELLQKDENRQINDIDKIAVFDKYDGICQGCGIKFKDHGEPDYHHKELYSLGGKTSTENITILCRGCHHKIHGSEKIELTTQEEEAEFDNE